MRTSSRILAIYLVTIATVVALNFILQAFYQTAVNVGELWDILDWFMAVAVPATLIIRYVQKVELDRTSNGESVTRQYVEVNVALYAAILLFLWFFWNWFDNLVAGSDPQGTLQMINWMFIDPLFILVVGTTGCRIWPRGRGES